LVGGGGGLGNSTFTVTAARSTLGNSAEAGLLRLGGGGGSGIESLSLGVKLGGGTGLSPLAGTAMGGLLSGVLVSFPSMLSCGLGSSPSSLRTGAASPLFAEGNCGTAALKGTGAIFSPGFSSTDNITDGVAILRLS